MDVVKKVGIIGGAVVGGVIGGTLSILGHVTKNKFVDELGENIIDSTILTGSIAGQIASGATDVIVGNVQKKPKHIEHGKNDLKAAGGKIIDNYVDNAKLIINNSGDIVNGVKSKDMKRVIKGTKTLGKIIAIGAITVGAIKIEPNEPETSDKNRSTPSQDQG